MTTLKEKHAGFGKLIKCWIIHPELMLGFRYLMALAHALKYVRPLMLLNDTFYGKYFFFCDNPPRFYYNCLTESFENHIAYSFFPVARCLFFLPWCTATATRVPFGQPSETQNIVESTSCSINSNWKMLSAPSSSCPSSPSSSRLFPVKKLIFLLHAFFLSSLCFITSAERIFKPFLNILNSLSYIRAVL